MSIKSLSTIFGCFNLHPQKHRYELVATQDPKKDDNYGISEINQWISSYPVDNSLFNRHPDQIHTYVRQLIKDLPVACITDANCTLISRHIAQIAKTSYIARDDLEEKVKSLNFPKAVSPAFQQKLRHMFIAITSQN